MLSVSVWVDSEGVRGESVFWGSFECVVADRVGEFSFSFLIQRDKWGTFKSNPTLHVNGTVHILTPLSLSHVH